MLRRGGELDGARILGPRTIDLMRRTTSPAARTSTEMAIGAFSETAYEGVGFGLGFATTLDEVAAGTLGEGDFYWGGAASHDLLGRPEGRPRRHLHDPAHAVGHLQLPRPAQEHHLLAIVD